MFDKRTHIAPEVRGEYWLNSPPLSIHALRGSVILLFFWDRTCIRSARMLDYIMELNVRYGEAGLVVIGVHSPAFEFGTRIETLEKALVERSIGFPVVMDNSRSVFEMYRNSETPATVIVDQEGNIRAQYHGRGKQQMIERDIQICLQDSGTIDTLPIPVDAVRPEEIPGVVCARETPQILFGYLRGSLGNNEGYNPESIYAYEDPGFYLPGRFYLSGIWRSDRNSITLEHLAAAESYIVVRYEGREVFALIGQKEEAPIRLYVSQDGVDLTEEIVGGDIQFDERDRSFVTVGTPRLVHLVSNEASAEHVLKIACQAAGTQMYSLTFIPGVVPELLGKN
jgi:hypothetical protein